MNVDIAELVVSTSSEWCLVEIARSITESESITGFVVQATEAWVLIHKSEDTWLNGYTAIRTKDVTEVNDVGGDDITVRALRHYGERPVNPESVTLSNPIALFETANKVFDLIGIYQEERFIDECYIGRFRGTSGETLLLQEINSHAEWETNVSTWDIASITRVDFGSRYELALRDIGGEPPDIADA